MSHKFGPLDPRMKAVVRLWRNLHISRGAISTYLQWVRRFQIYCKEHRWDETTHLTLDGAVRFTRSYVGPRTKGRVSASSCLVARNALHAWAFALGVLGTSVPEWRPRDDAPRVSPLLSAYCEFRRSHGGVAERTLQLDIETAKLFISLLRNRGKGVQRATVGDIDAFIQHLSLRLSRRTVARRCSSLRSFLRFLRATGRLDRDLAAYVMAPRIGISERPPRALPWTDVRRILRSIPQTQSPGKRDFTMLLMLSLYGLGAVEVLALQLEDVGWRAKVLRVRRPKTGTRIELPLLPPVARSLIAYLKMERPSSARTRRIFVGVKIPYRPLTSAAIRHQIRYYARRIGVTAPVIGAHAFRHSHASRQIDAGANPTVVSNILGHRRPSSTSVYVRVALRRLREVALRVPR